MSVRRKRLATKGGSMSRMSVTAPLLAKRRGKSTFNLDTLNDTDEVVEVDKVVEVKRHTKKRTRKDVVAEQELVEWLVALSQSHE